MTELEVYDKILDCQDLLDKIQDKRKTDIINNIVDRYNTYYQDNKKSDLRSLNNAILENKIKNTLIEILIIQKINEMKLPSDYQEIYTNIPYTIEEQKEYVTNLNDSYELVYKCYNLLIEMEMLFETEYEVDYEEFKSSEYAKLIRYLTDLFKHATTGTQPLEYTLKQIGAYLDNLDLKQTQTLYYESLSLCYTRNVFDNLDSMISCFNIAKDNGIDYVTVTNDYMTYQQMIFDTILNKLNTEKSLSEVYASISDIHNSKHVKKLIRNK